MLYKSCIKDFCNVPLNLKTLFKENPKNLNELQRKFFAEFLNEFKDIFSEDVVAENCTIEKHVINVKDSLPPIK